MRWDAIVGTATKALLGRDSVSYEDIYEALKAAHSKLRYGDYQGMAWDVADNLKVFGAQIVGWNGTPPGGSKPLDP